MPWVRWQDLASPAFARFDAGTALALLEVGAVEQHGPHLPVGTDTAICRAIVDAALARLADDTMVVRLPMLAIGVSGEHRSFAGTLSLEPETAIALLSDIGRSVAASGFNKLLLFNTHGGQPQVIDIVAQRLRRETGMLVVRANSFRFEVPPELVSADERRYGLHGGLVETALMLAIAPATVRSEHLARFASWAEVVETGCRQLRIEAGNGIGWLAEDLNRQGVVGDAAAATAELGQVLLDHLAGRLAALIADAQRLPWPPAPPAD